MEVSGNAAFDLVSLCQVLDFFHQSVTLSPMVVTITNYQNGACEYVSPTFKDLSGHDPVALKEGGMNWWVSHIHPEDRSQYKINFSEGFLFLINTTAEQKMKCYFNLTARLLHKKGQPIWMYQQCRPIAFDAQGKPLYSLNIITDLTHLLPANGQPCWSVIEQNFGIKPVLLGGSCGENLQWLFGSARSPLTKKETQVMKLLMKGLSGKQLASRLRISINTVNTHRKSIIRKAHAKNINEAISTALQNDWINE